MWRPFVWVLRESILELIRAKEGESLEEIPKNKENDLKEHVFYVYTFPRKVGVRNLAQGMNVILQMTMILLIFGVNDVTLYINPRCIFFPEASEGVVYFGFVAFHVTRLYGPKLWVFDPYGLSGRIQYL
ncbi:Photosystem II CP47 reaction center protein, partial [Mucuna pruriens]